MKTVKKILFSVIALVLVFACNTIDPVNPHLPKTQKTDFHLEAEVVSAPFYNQDNLQLEIPGASSCSIGESVMVTIFGVIGHADQNGNIELPYGQIDFINPESGCYLIGKFIGNVNNDPVRLIIDATVKIDYGVGIFKADGGVLNLTIIGTPEVDRKMNYTIEIDGYLENRIQVASN